MARKNSITDISNKAEKLLQRLGIDYVDAHRGKTKNQRALRIVEIERRYVENIMKTKSQLNASKNIKEASRQMHKAFKKGEDALGQRLFDKWDALQDKANSRKYSRSTYMGMAAKSNSTP